MSTITPQRDPNSDERELDTSTRLALDRTQLAVTRSDLASERTLMAWIRTSLSMISFGFTIYKFFQYLLESKTLGDSWEPRGPHAVGSMLVVLGTVLLIIATMQHWLFRRRLQRLRNERLPFSLALLAAGLMVLLGLMALLNLFFRLGPL
ncbi:MAG: YidH family protein [Gammaproteobacteria bacterium]